MTMKPERLPIYGSATLDNPKGVVTTKEGAQRIARRNMPADLAKAGFSAYVTRGNFSNFWFIQYSK